ncbi:hypothetical protein ACFYWN_11270 [Streptomyces sp. NPDC002917]|uniref:hypothetical protein n=1 Tax=unclassified Streptomyces TaxID=2593676 RepID=UPI0036C11BB6
MGRPLAAHQLDEDTGEIRGDYSADGDDLDLNGRGKSWGAVPTDPARGRREVNWPKACRGYLPVPLVAASGRLGKVTDDELMGWAA